MLTVPNQASGDGTLRVQCTVPRYNNAGSCEAPILRLADTSKVTLYWHVFGPVTFSDYSPPLSPGTQFIRGWTLPSGLYAVHVQPRNRAGFGCDTTAFFMVIEPPASPFIH
jgi:hypothetical protein